jgi:hypothetical protein
MALKLDSLPTELIQRIALFSSCEDVLALLKVNRRLHEACSHHSVFRAILENGQSQQVKDPWDLTFLTGNMSASDWARFALADARAWGWPKTQKSLFPEFGLDKYNKSQKTLETLHRGLVHWAPQLAALHHPFFDKIEMLGLTHHLLYAFFEHEKDMKAIEFCVQAAVLCRGLAARMNPNERVSQEICNEIYSVENDLRMRGGPVIPSQITLFHACSNCSLADYSPTLTQAILPPSRIPFQSFMNLPVPFSKPPLNNLQSSYLPTMTSKSFLEDGEWVGYYTVMSTPLNPARFDTPVHGIKFVTRPDPLGDALKIKATGKDSHGDFELAGLIAFNGKVELRKSIRNDYRIQPQGWHGQMTPFGIVGHWARFHVIKPGELWLWKKEWLDESLR